MAECEPKNLAKAIESAKKRGITLAIVDTPPHAGQFAYFVAETVDFNLIPCRPAPFDLRAIGKTVDIIAQLNAPAGIVINAAPPNRGDIEMPVTVDARKVLSRYNLPVSPVAIIERPVYQHPMQDGRTYIEHFPTGKPAADIAALWAWVQGQMGLTPKARPNQASPQARPSQASPRPGAARAANAGAAPQGSVRQAQSAAAKAAGPVRQRPAEQSAAPAPIAARAGR
jgi:chromosome partitioning protein